VLGFNKSIFPTPIKYSFPSSLPLDKAVKDILEMEGKRPHIEKRKFKDRASSSKEKAVTRVKILRICFNLSLTRVYCLKF
jgi:hypothetical protein